MSSLDEKSRMNRERKTPINLTKKKELHHHGIIDPFTTRQVSWAKLRNVQCGSRQWTCQRESRRGVVGTFTEYIMGTEPLMEKVNKRCEPSESPWSNQSRGVENLTKHTKSKLEAPTIRRSESQAGRPLLASQTESSGRAPHGHTQ